MTRSLHTPDTIASPSSDYAHAVKVTDATTWVHASGQVGEHADGTLAGDTSAQMEVIWQRLFAILEDAGLTKQDIVKVTAYLTRSDDVGIYREVRDRMLEGHMAASTLLIVSGLAKPQWTAEIEVIAAR